MTRKPQPRSPEAAGLESAFDIAFAADLALREKQIQQAYRPVIGVHKWFARRPGTLFRCLLLAEHGREPLSTAYWKPQRLRGTIADPFMGGGTILYEASRLGFSVLGCDINPMSWWLVSRAFAPLDLEAFAARAAAVVDRVAAELGPTYQTTCLSCGDPADIKYVLWVRQQDCPGCGATQDLYPSHLLADDQRHPRHVLVCGACGALQERATLPTPGQSDPCGACQAPLRVEGAARRGRCTCQGCGASFAVPGADPGAPRHRMWALEYHCSRCYPDVVGRQFKAPDAQDLARASDAADALAAGEDALGLPEDAIPPGDETDRLHRWGYHRYRDLFHPRQLLLLGRLRQHLRAEPDGEIRDALLTVFSDILRYNNLLCRYDTGALKCQDVFSLHGFPVGLLPCENNPLGIPGVGSGGFRHFVEKYLLAKQYCVQPFEIRVQDGKREQIPMPGERIGIAASQRRGKHDRSVTLRCAPAQTVDVTPASLDGVYTDPPYFANVQYAELIDFCYVWLRDAVRPGLFVAPTTRSAHEASGNAHEGRGVRAFTEALSAVFVRFARGLKPGRPFVFTYHHNDPAAYAPLVVALLDAGLTCTEVLPAAGEMSASRHIAGTASSVLDSVFVCRVAPIAPDPLDRALAAPGLFGPSLAFAERLRGDLAQVASGGVHVGPSEARCVATGLVARAAARRLGPGWRPDLPVSERLAAADAAITEVARAVQLADAVAAALTDPARRAPCA